MASFKDENKASGMNQEDSAETETPISITLNPNANAFTTRKSTADSASNLGEGHFLNGDGGSDPESSFPSGVDASLEEGAPASDVGKVVAAPDEAGAPAPDEEGASASEGASAPDGLSAVDIGLEAEATAAKVMTNNVDHVTSLMGVDGPANKQDHAVQAPGGAQSPEDPSLQQRIQNQLEYYFSRDNLRLDHYLKSQMNDDHYVPISVVAAFPKIAELTSDSNLVIGAMKNSKFLQMNEDGTRVRARSCREILMLREIPWDTPQEEVEALFKSEKCPQFRKCEFEHNDYWSVTFKDDVDAAAAYFYLKQENIMFRGKPVLARFKAHQPLVRGSATRYTPNTNHQSLQQDSTVPFIPQQQSAFPIMNAQIPQYAYQICNYSQVPLMAPPQWSNAAATQGFMDPSAMMSINGFHPTGIKPPRNTYQHHGRNNNNRGVGKPHRPQSVSSDKVHETRSQDRPHNLSTVRANPRSNQLGAAEPLSQPPPFSRSRSEGSSANEHIGSAVQSNAVSAPTPLLPEGNLPQHLPVHPPSINKDPVSATVSQKRGGNNRRRRNDGDKNDRPQGGRNGRPQESHFELEATSFPPLPGASGNSASGDSLDRNKLSDVVKGKGHRTRPEAPLTSVASTSSAVSSTLSTSSAVDSSSACSAEKNEISGSSAVANPAEENCDDSGSSPLRTDPPASATVHLSTQSETTCKATNEPAVSGASEVCAAPSKELPVSTSASTVSVSLPAQAPVRLSYAQMLSKNPVRTETKQECKEGVTASTSAPTAPASASTAPASASTAPASASTAPASVPTVSTSASSVSAASVSQCNGARPKIPAGDANHRDGSYNRNRQNGRRRDNRQSRGKHNRQAEGDKRGK